MLLIHNDEQIRKEVHAQWPNLATEETSSEAKSVAATLEILALEAGDPLNGKPLYASKCAQCHQLFGAGGMVGPDLTTHNRKDTRLMLRSIIEPDAEIREGFENQTILIEDGRVLTGFIVDEDSQVVQLRTPEGQTITVSIDEIEARKANQKSIMPSKLLDDLSDSQIRDLFAFLRSSQPIVD
jgi:putative heme-binding domain-containing protein